MLAMIGSSIRAARKRAGFTQESLAALIGVEQGTVARYERGNIQPPQKMLKKLAEALGVPVHELIYSAVSTDQPPPIPASFSAPGRPFTPAPSIGHLPKDLPVFGSVLGADMELTQNGEGIYQIERLELSLAETIDYVRRPAGLMANPGAYGLYVQGASMSPRHEQGDLIYVDTRRPPAGGDDVVVQLRGAEGDDQTVISAMVKRLRRRTSAFVELEQYNPALRFRVPVEIIHAMHRVVRLAELLGI